MSLRNGIGFVLKVVALGIVMLVVLAVVSGVALPAEMVEAQGDADSAATMLRLLVIQLVNASILGLLVTQSRWRGWRLIVGLAFAFYGVQTLVGQIEAVVFLTPLGEQWGAGSVPVLTMPSDFIAAQFVIGAATALIGVPLAAFLFGKGRGGGKAPATLNPGISAPQWLWKLGLVIVLYELLYFGFGYFVAWKNPAVLAFYQGTDPGFLGQLKNVVTETPALIPFQALRALLWAAFLLPVTGMLRHKGWIGALLTGLLASLPMNIPHIVPNPYMPAAVRLAHFVETASSTFIFGMLVFWLLHRAHSSVADLLGAAGGESDVREVSHQF